MLTGQPRFADVLTPYMAFETPMDVRWDDSESVWRQYEDKAWELVEEHNRLKGRGGWRGLSWSDLKQLHGILRAGSFNVTPYTRALGDPPVAELLVPCRRTSPLQETAPLWHVDTATRQRVYRLEVEFESVATYPSVPGALYGGLVLVGETDEAIEVETWGTASWSEGTLDVEFDGVVYTVETLTLQPDEIADLVLFDDPADPDAYVLDAINDFQAPPPQAES